MAIEVSFPIQSTGDSSDSFKSRSNTDLAGYRFSIGALTSGGDAHIGSGLLKPGLAHDLLPGLVLDDRSVRNGKSEPSIERDGQGRIASIAYSGGERTRQFTHAEDGRLTAIETTEWKNGTRAASLIQREAGSGRWYTEIDGDKFYRKGDIELRANGDLAFGDRSGAGAGASRVETPSGRSFRERTSVSGARIVSDDMGNVESIVRQDGSAVYCSYKDGKLATVDERATDGKKTSWTKACDQWRSDSNRDPARHHLQIEKNGNLTFLDESGEPHTILGDGKEQRGKLKYSYDNEGRIDSVAFESGFRASHITYRPGTNQIESVQVKQAGSDKTLTYQRLEGNTWSVTDQSGVRAKADWHGDLQVAADGSYKCLDLESRDGKAASGLWAAYQPDGTVCNERHNADGSIQQSKKDGTVIDIDAQGRLRQVTTGGGNERACTYDERGLSEVRDTTKNGISVWQRDKQEGGKERSDLQVGADGSLSYSLPDGSRVAERPDLSRVVHDGAGRLTRVDDSHGSSRSFDYDRQSGELTSITDTRRSPEGVKSREWLAFAQSDGSISLAYSGQDGKVQTRHNVKVDGSGNYSYLDEKGADRSARVGQLRDATEFPWSSDKVDDARERLLEGVRPQLDDKRYARLEGMMREFEKRESDLVEMRRALGDDASKVRADFNQKIAGVYDNLAELVTSKSTDATLYDQKTRVKLAENFMYHCADPTTMNQGSKGSCWIQSGHIVGMVDHPDAMARLLTDISLTDSFTSKNNGENDASPKTFTFDRNRLAIGPGNWGANWSIDTADKTVTRSPVGMIFDESLSAMAGRQTSDAGYYSTTRKLMYMVTGDVVYDSNNQKGSEAETLMRHGAYITYAPNHMRTRQLRKEGDHWQIVQDDQHGDWADRVIANVPNLHDYLKSNRAYIATGPVNHHVPGAENIDTPFTPTAVNPYQPQQYNPTGDDNDCQRHCRRRRFRIFRRWCE